MNADKDVGKIARSLAVLAAVAAVTYAGKRVIPGNATTQFYGLLNSPTQIAVAREMAPPCHSE